jgi:hypothetical protein
VKEKTMARSTELILSGAVLVVGLAACGGGSSSDGVGGAGASGGAGATGGTATGGAGALGGAGATGGGSGGSPPAGCDPYDSSACDTGLVCTVVDEQLGVEGGTACVAPGTKPAFSACGGAGECAAGSFCDAVTATCKPMCENSLGCPDEGACTPAQTSAGVEIPGLKLCVSGCEPVATSGCDQSEGAVNCTWRVDLMAFDCIAAGPTGEAFACTEHAECAMGLGCLEVNGQLGCLHWCVYDGGTDICTAAEHPDATFAICVPQAPGISAGGTDYGGCLKQL